MGQFVPVSALSAVAARRREARAAQDPVVALAPATCDLLPLKLLLGEVEVKATEKGVGTVA
jgi:hypothetical protein